jgi:hypothetical protein
VVVAPADEVDEAGGVDVVKAPMVVVVVSDGNEDVVDSRPFSVRVVGVGRPSSGAVSPETTATMRITDDTATHHPALPRSDMPSTPVGRIRLTTPNTRASRAREPSTAAMGW